ncbi:MAG: M23 family metallopeptidase [Pseudomonadota bacterium]
MNRRQKQPGTRISQLRAALFVLACLMISSAPLAQQTALEEAPQAKDPNAYQLDSSQSYPGGIVQLSLEKISDTLPLVRFGIREPVIIEKTQAWQVLIGLDLDLLPGEYVIYVKQPDSELPGYSIKFDVTQKNYPVASTPTVPAPQIPRRIEHSRFSDLDFSNTGQPTLPLRPPIPEDWEDSFGRVETGDIDATSETQNVSQNFIYYLGDKPSVVIAPQNAIVSRIQRAEPPATSTTIFLDHGRGLYSIITGLADLSVDTGNGVVAGAVIGKTVNDIGGQAIPLAWQTTINGAYINPLILQQLKLK